MDEKNKVEDRVFPFRQNRKYIQGRDRKAKITIETNKSQPTLLLPNRSSTMTSISSKSSLGLQLCQVSGDYREPLTFHTTSHHSVLPVTEVAKSLWEQTKVLEGRKHSPLFSLLTLPLVRSASQFKGDVLAGQAGFTLLAGLEAASPSTVTGSNPEGFCGSMVPRVAFSPVKEVCVEYKRRT